MSQITITDDMKKAVELIEQTNQHIFITGKAGTGKTTFLRYIVSNIKKRFVISASTGIAAINAGGVTLHSLLRIPLGVLPPNAAIKGMLPKDKFILLNSIDALIIDEISMVRPDVLDYVDKRLRQVRGSEEPFGGIQIIMFGDLYQLPPVVKNEEANILEAFYDGYYFFNAQVFKEVGFNVVELNHIFRQSDPRFIEILNNIRSYKITEGDIEDLGALRDKYMSEKYDTTAIHICTHRKDVERINKSMLNEPTHTFEAQIEKEFNIGHAPCDKELELRIGARVMTLVNNKTQGFYNGSLGVVQDIADDKILVALDNGCTAVIERYTWEACDYVTENGKIVKKVKGSCTQFPLTLAWAITIHKSQGLTFDQIVIHTKGVFCPGQIYVALSRCTSMEGVISDSFISQRHIMPDEDLMAFENAYKQTNNYFGKETQKLIKQ